MHVHTSHTLLTECVYIIVGVHNLNNHQHELIDQYDMSKSHSLTAYFVVVFNMKIPGKLSCLYQLCPISYSNMFLWQSLINWYQTSGLLYIFIDNVSHLRKRGRKHLLRQFNWSSLSNLKNSAFNYISMLRNWYLLIIWWTD